MIVFDNWNVGHKVYHDADSTFVTPWQQVHRKQSPPVCARRPHPSWIRAHCHSTHTVMQSLTIWQNWVLAVWWFPALTKFLWRLYSALKHCWEQKVKLLDDTPAASHHSHTLRELWPSMNLIKALAGVSQTIPLNRTGFTTLSPSTIKPLDCSSQTSSTKSGSTIWKNHHCTVSWIPWYLR